MQSVRALKKGFYNGDLIEEGQVFQVKKSEVGSWFEPIASAKDKDEDSSSSKAKK